MKRPINRRGGFTLIELLVVITIIGILMSLLLPAVQQVREAARRIQCSNNLKQLGLAQLTYETSFKVLPFGSAYAHRGGTWCSAILPNIEQQAVYDAIDFNVMLTDARNRTAVTAVISVFICPSDGNEGDALQGGRIQHQHNPPKSMGLWYPASMGPTRDGTSSSNSCTFCPAGVPSYCCQGSDYGSSNPPGNFVGLYGRWPKSIPLAAVRDGLSNTIMLGETIPSQCTFNGAYNHNFPLGGTAIPLNTFEETVDGQNSRWWIGCGFKSFHPGGASFVLADGSVHFFPEGMDYRTYNLLGHRADGEVVTLP